MSTLSYILLFTFLGSVVSLIGGIALLFKKTISRRLTEYVSAFAAGALLATAFFDLLPEAFETGEVQSVLNWTLIGILVFFLLQRFIHWFHHHEHDGEHHKPTGPLILLGDCMHNFIDGVAIAITFLINPVLGALTTLAVGAHEIPHEIGNFGILLNAGYSRKKVLWYNLAAAGTAFAGALLAYAFGAQITSSLPIFLGLTAGFFIYIATADLIPEIHGWSEGKLAVAESVLLLVGVATIGILIQLLEH